jgi:hypothetical protein
VLDLLKTADPRPVRPGGLSPPGQGSLQPLPRRDVFKQAHELPPCSSFSRRPPGTQHGLAPSSCPPHASAECR